MNGRGNGSLSEERENGTSAHQRTSLLNRWEFLMPIISFCATLNGVRGVFAILMFVVSLAGPPANAAEPTTRSTERAEKSVEMENSILQSALPAGTSMIVDWDHTGTSIFAFDDGILHANPLFADDDNPRNRDASFAALQSGSGDLAYDDAEGGRAWGAVDRLRQKGVVVCFEEAASGQNSTIGPIDLKQASMHDLLNALFGPKSPYRWELVDGTGVICVLPRKGSKIEFVVKDMKLNGDWQAVVSSLQPANYRLEFPGVRAVGISFELPAGKSIKLDAKTAEKAYQFLGRVCWAYGSRMHFDIMPDKDDGSTDLFFELGR